MNYNQTVKEYLPTLQDAIMKKTFWRGIPLWKCPTDIATYQRIIWDRKPDVIIEIGTKYGASALMFLDFMKMTDVLEPTVYTIDIDNRLPKAFHRMNSNHDIICIQKSAPECLPEIEKHLSTLQLERGLPFSVMVVEDSSHTYTHTLACLNAFAPLVTKGNYYVVEDTIVNTGLERVWEGPNRAVKEFLAANTNFLADPSCEAYGISWNPGGFLMRII